MIEPLVLDKITKILNKSNIKHGNVLGIGSSPHHKDVLHLDFFKKHKENFNITGINISGNFGNFGNFEVIKCDAHNIVFNDNYFDIILCNSMLEHDGEFWLTIQEINRVLKPGGIFIAITQGYVDELAEKYVDMKFVSDRVKYDFCCSTLTYQIHGDDYYRFSQKSFQDIIFKGMINVNVVAVMRPPRIIGWGYGNK